ncbi:MAG TPA: tetratricopeptide repeat protein [Gemmataceae bacterium]|nr:tetratricopeptide repeat protein [Gemmataceae bacterium]
MGSPTESVSVWQRARCWWRDRNWRTFAAGAPALVAALGAGSVMVTCWTGSDRELQARYLTEGKAAFQAKDYPRALTCYERVVPGSPDPEPVYRLALTVEALGDTGRAASLMRTIIPDEGPGYAPGHYWWARKLLAAPPSTGTRAAAEEHLLKALAGDLEDKDAAHGLLGQLYLSTNRPAEAEFHLSKAVATHSIFRLPLARTFAARGNAGRARQEAELAVRFFRERAKSDSANLTARLAWADATTFLEDYPGAIGVLDEGFAVTGDPTYRVAAARVYLAWFDTRKKEPAPTANELLTLLDKGLTNDPANQDLLNRLLDLLRVGGPDADTARATLRSLLARGGAGGAHIHFALAVDARLRGDTAAEILHLEQAHRLDPKMGLIANNLAWVLSKPPTPDLPRALTLANLAVEREPANPMYRDTRGRILLAQQKWAEALVDLEITLAKAPETPGLHAALADAYEHFGQPAEAAEYRKLAGPPGK